MNRYFIIPAWTVVLSLGIAAALVHGNRTAAVSLANKDMTVFGGAAGCGGCKNQECDKTNPFFNYGCQKRDSGNGLQWTKKVGSGNTVAICDGSLKGGCVFGSTEKICFTVYICGDDATCTDCSEDPYWVPD